MSFVATLPTTRDHVRLRLGDVLGQDTDEIWSDDVYDAVLLTLGVDDDPAIAGVTGIRRAALQMAKNGMGRFARDVDENPNGISNSRSQKFQHFKDLVAELQSEIARGPAEIFVGGASKSRNSAVNGDADFTGSAFSLGMHTNVGGDG